MIKSLIQLVKYSKNPRIGLINTIRIFFGLQLKKKETTLNPTTYYKQLYLRPNMGDWICFDQIFISLSYGKLEDLGPIHTVIDVGANIGLSSVFFSSRLNNPKIIALEPEERNYKQALKNTRAYNNIQVIHGGIWPKKSTLTICNSDSSGSLGFQLKEVTKSMQSSNQVNCFTISEILESQGWETLDLLKLDIEGAEKELFEDHSCQDWINRVKILVIELHDWIKPHSSRSFFRAISKFENMEFQFSGENLIFINRDLPGQP